MPQRIHQFTNIGSKRRHIIGHTKSCDALHHLDSCNRCLKASLYATYFTLLDFARLHFTKASTQLLVRLLSIVIVRCRLKVEVAGRDRSCRSETPVTTLHTAVGSRSGGTLVELTTTGEDTAAWSTSSVRSRPMAKSTTQLTCPN